MKSDIKEFIDNTQNVILCSLDNMNRCAYFWKLRYKETNYLARKFPIKSKDKVLSRISFSVTHSGNVKVLVFKM